MVREKTELAGYLGLSKTEVDALITGKLAITFLDYDWKLNTMN
jgi:hypothetical protein